MGDVITNKCRDKVEAVIVPRPEIGRERIADSGAGVYKRLEVELLG